MAEKIFLLGETKPISKQKRIIYDNQKASWWDTLSLTREVKAFSQKLSNSRKRLVFAFCRNNIGSVLSYLAAASSGHVVALLDGKSKPETKKTLIHLYRPDMVICDAESQLNRELGRSYPSVHPLGFNCILFRRTSFDSDVPLNEDLAVLLTTSGSTGSPKMVRLSRTNVLSNAKAIAKVLDINSAERSITSLPIHYSFGLSVLNSHLISGASIVLTDGGPLDASFWKLFRKMKCTSFAGVPFSYHLLERIGFMKMDFPTLNTMTQAGGRMSNELIQRYFNFLSRRAGRLAIMYGQTEATARITCLPFADLPRKIGSVGPPIPGGKIQIMTEKGLTVNANRVGEVIYTGPNVMMGYANSKEDLSKRDEMSSVLATGDLGYLDDDGYLYIVGRKKRFSKLFGLRINLDDVERFMGRYGETAVVGNDEKIKLFCSYGNESRYREYARELSNKLRLPVTVFEFHFTKKIPLTTSGKIDYKLLE
jgi:long-chain acyl-CoA synthetase